MNEELQRIDGLLAEEYDADENPPIEASAIVAKAFLKAGFEDLKERMPKANFITPDCAGGLRIEYRQDGKHLRLVINPSRLYLYWQNGDESDAATRPTNQFFISKLIWLME